MALELRHFGQTRRSLLRSVALFLPAVLAGPAAAQTGALLDHGAAEEAEVPEPILASALRKWTGDLDGMVERGMIRIAIPFGLTTYFLDGPDQRGLTYDAVVQFERFLRKRLGSRRAG